MSTDKTTTLTPILPLQSTETPPGVEITADNTKPLLSSASRNLYIEGYDLTITGNVNIVPRRVS